MPWSFRLSSAREFVWSRRVEHMRNIDVALSTVASHVRRHDTSTPSAPNTRTLLINLKRCHSPQPRTGRAGIRGAIQDHHHRRRKEPLNIARQRESCVERPFSAGKSSKLSSVAATQPGQPACLSPFQLCRGQLARSRARLSVPRHGLRTPYSLMPPTYIPYILSPLAVPVPIVVLLFLGFPFDFASIFFLSLFLCLCVCALNVIVPPKLALPPPNSPIILQQQP
jgi:hypothetical protein